MKTVFHKEYDGESICDVERDVLESLSETYNPMISEIPVDENFIPQGKFIVTIQWSPYEDE